jgi:hypothetical protein
MGTPPPNGRPGRDAVAGRLGPVSPRAAFVAFFNIEDPDPTEYQVGIPQVLRLMNAPGMNGLAKLGATIRESKSHKEAVEKLYLSVLSRKPTATEMSKMLAHVRQQDEPRKGYADILWAMLNSSEFSTNH